MQQVVVQLIDDLDQSAAAETVAFSLDGIAYEIDLSEEHAENLRSSLSTYTTAGRRVPGRRAGGQARPAPRAKAAAGNLSEVREWARAQGMSVSDRGRIPAAIQEAYAAAH